jgi:uncharacterized membrane-anchored protein YitT (DUF2179 family)
MEVQQNAEPTKLADSLIRYISITIGAFIFAYCLESLIIPNHLIDGGIVGISLILEELTPIAFSLILIALNIPFIIVGYKHLGKSFSYQCFYGIILASFFTEVLHNVPPITNDPLLGAVFGGGILGIGIGIVLRNNGALDGTEILATVISSKSSFSVGNVVLFFNLFIFLLASIVYGINSAFYSIIAYLVAAKMIDLIINGMNETKALLIITERADVIGDALLNNLGKTVTYFTGEGGYSRNQKKVIYCVVNRLEETKLIEIVRDFDPNAFLAMTDVSKVKGGQFKKRNFN